MPELGASNMIYAIAFLGEGAHPITRPLQELLRDSENIEALDGKACVDLLWSLSILHLADNTIVDGELIQKITPLISNEIDDLLENGVKSARLYQAVQHLPFNHVSSLVDSLKLSPGQYLGGMQYHEIAGSVTSPDEVEGLLGEAGLGVGEGESTPPMNELDELKGLFNECGMGNDFDGFFQSLGDSPPSAEEASFTTPSSLAVLDEELPTDVEKIAEIARGDSSAWDVLTLHWRSKGIRIGRAADHLSFVLNNLLSARKMSEAPHPGGEMAWEHTKTTGGFELKYHDGYDIDWAHPHYKIGVILIEWKHTKQDTRQMMGKEQLRIAGLVSRGWKIIPVRVDDILSTDEQTAKQLITSTNGS